MEYNWVALVSVFGAALASSLHCSAMCGGIVLAATESKVNLQPYYHLSRLVGYLLLGSLAGYLGEVGTLLAFLMSIVLIVLGVLALINREPKYLTHFTSGIAQKIALAGVNKTPKIRASLFGFASVFLPCGLLYSFVLLAVASHSYVWGALILLFFWAGTIPALVGGQLVIQKMVKTFRIDGKKAVAVLMIIAGIGSIAFRFQNKEAHVIHDNEHLICH